MAEYEGNMEIAYFGLHPTTSAPFGGASVARPDPGVTYITVQEDNLLYTLTGATVGTGPMNPEYPLLTGVVPEVIP
jgi:hypothetical protein